MAQQDRESQMMEILAAHITGNIIKAQKSPETTDKEITHGGGSSKRAPSSSRGKGTKRKDGKPRSTSSKGKGK